MNKHLFSLAAFGLLTAGASAQAQTWSQSTDNTTIVGGSASCLTTGVGITDNSYWRLYDPVDCGVTADYEINSVTFGVENASTSTAGFQTITVNVRDGSMFPSVANMPILFSATVDVMDTDVTFQTFETAMMPANTVPAGTLVAIEVMAPNGQTAPAPGNFFFIGSNTLGETPLDSSYLSAADCGIVDPVPTSAVGFNVQFIIDLEAEPAVAGPIGTPYCPNNPNSTGVPGELAIVGSTSAAAMDVRLDSSMLPPMQFGYYIGSRTQGFIANPGGSLGNICVLGNQGRYNDAGAWPATPGTGSAGTATSATPATSPARWKCCSTRLS
jgi:hypothetical protein